MTAHPGRRARPGREGRVRRTPLPGARGIARRDTPTTSSTTASMVLRLDAILDGRELATACSSTSRSRPTATAGQGDGGELGHRHRRGAGAGHRVLEIDGEHGQVEVEAQLRQLRLDAMASPGRGAGHRLDVQLRLDGASWPPPRSWTATASRPSSASSASTSSTARATGMVWDATLARENHGKRRAARVRG